MSNTPDASAIQPQMIADYSSRCGEGPLWHPTEKRLYWTDIPSGKLYWYDPATGKHEMCWHEQGRQIGGFTLQADGSLLLFMERGTVAVYRDGKIVRTLIEQIDDEVHTRFNDVIADPAGRVFCGTMPVPKGEGRVGRPGRLYRLDTDGSLCMLLEGIGCSNGMGFSPDGKTMYYTDSPKKEIYAFDYDRDTGDIRNQRVIIDSKNEPGVPDGMTVDAHGDIWSARWDGSCCTCYSPDGKEKKRLLFPVKKVSCVLFGGKDYRDMYFTTAGGDNRDANGALAGALFKVNDASLPGGVAEFVSRVDLKA